MYVKVTRSGPRRYVQLVESFRDAQGRPRQRTVATLGRVDALTAQEVDALIQGLLRATGRAAPVAADEARFAPALSWGDTWLLWQLWQQLGLGAAIRAVVAPRRTGLDVEALLRVMVFNRLCDPESKLGVLRWLQTTRVPGVRAETVTHQRLLRAMDVLEARHAAIETAVAGLVRPLLDAELSLVFYDMTSIAVAGNGEVAGELRQYGRAKEGGIARQCLLGLVQTAEGLPLACEVFTGNTVERSTLLQMVETVTARLRVRRVVLVADRGLLSLDTLDALGSLTLPSGQPLEFIVAVPARRYGDLADSVRVLQEGLGWTQATDEQVGESRWQGRRLVVAHDPVRAAEQSAERDRRVAAIEQQGEVWVQRLLGEARTAGRRLSAKGAAARLHHLVSEARLGHILQVDFEADAFCWALDEAALDRARLFDGKLIVVTNHTDLAPAAIIERYRALADIERGFRVLKSELEIGPMYHRLPTRIRAHALICFLALLLHRVLRLRLKAHPSPLSPERLIESLQATIQYHRVSVGAKTLTGVTTLQPEQAALFDTLGIPKPRKEGLGAGM
jgi:Transposase DDE domain